MLTVETFSYFIAGSYLQLFCHNTLVHRQTPYYDYRGALQCNCESISKIFFLKFQTVSEKSAEIPGCHIFSAAL